MRGRFADWHAKATSGPPNQPHAPKSFDRGSAPDERASASEENGASQAFFATPGGPGGPQPTQYRGRGVYPWSRVLHGSEPDERSEEALGCKPRARRMGPRQGPWTLGLAGRGGGPRRPRGVGLAGPLRERQVQRHVRPRHPDVSAPDEMYRRPIAPKKYARKRDAARDFDENRGELAATRSIERAICSLFMLSSSTMSAPARKASSSCDGDSTSHSILALAARLLGSEHRARDTAARDDVIVLYENGAPEGVAMIDATATRTNSAPKRAFRAWFCGCRRWRATAGGDRGDVLAGKSGDAHHALNEVECHAFGHQQGARGALGCKQRRFCADERAFGDEHFDRMFAQT